MVYKPMQASNDPITYHSLSVLFFETYMREGRSEMGRLSHENAVRLQELWNYDPVPEVFWKDATYNDCPITYMGYADWHADCHASFMIQYQEKS
jgi:hypothetical protein